MTREEKCLLAITKGFIYNKETGKIFGPMGRESKRVICGYYTLNLKIGSYNNAKQYNLKVHQLIWFIENNEVVDCIDHIDGNKFNNNINNLRSVSAQENRFNTKVKGYKFDKRSGKYEARITLSGKYIHLGTFNNKEDASNAYLEAKKIYHIIKNN